MQHPIIFQSNEFVILLFLQKRVRSTEQIFTPDLVEDLTGAFKAQKLLLDLDTVFPTVLYKIPFYLGTKTLLHNHISMKYVPLTIS